jgi:oligopeptide transport system substrate-binding protein
MNLRSPLARPIRALAPCAAILCCALTGCGRRETRVESADLTQTLLVGNLAEPNDLDPALTIDNTTRNIVMALMEGLAQYDPKTALPVPAIAERWEASPDGLTWTFHLRAGARWSDGDPVVAGDFVYAFRRILSPGLAAEQASMLFILRNAEAFEAGRISDPEAVGARAPDDRTLVLTLEKPAPYLPMLVCNTPWYPVHRPTIEKFGRMDQRGSAWTRPGNYVGDGPFTLAEWVPHQVIRVVRSPTYWDAARVRLREIDFYPIEDNAAEEAAFRSGQLHLTATIPIDKIPVYRADPARSALLRESPLLATYFYFFNVTRPPLNDARVRRALACAIDRRELVERVTLGGQLPAGHLTPPDTAGFTAAADVPSDPALARRLLAEAGFPGGRGFPVLELLYNTNQGHREIGEAIQQMWRRELGITVDLRNEESKVEEDSLRQHRYDIGRSGWIGDYLDPSTFLDLMMGDNGNNYSGWSDPEFDRIVREADHEPDRDRRFALYQRAERILVEQCPIAPIYFYTRDNLRLPDVRGWYDNLLDVHPYTGVFLEAPGR